MTDSRHGQLRRSMVPVYSGLWMATPVGYSGLLRTTSGLLRTTSGLLRLATPATGVLDTLPKGAPPYAGLWPALSSHQILTSPHFTSYPVRDLCYNPQIHPNTFITTHIEVTSSNIIIIPAIQYITIINTYSLVHPLVRAPETRLTHYFVARPGAIVDGAKCITRSP